MAVRIADAISTELTPEMRAAFDAADLLIELEARYLAQHLDAAQLEGIYLRERTAGDLHDVAVALRACQIADAPLHGPRPRPAFGSHRDRLLALMTPVA